MTARLRFAPDVLRRLGEELNPSPEQGILELVRNAYDADATRCVVKLKDVTTTGGEVRISDNGSGMTIREIRDSWLVLGKSQKQSDERTAKRNRLQVGSKGLGRLAALRLGTIAQIRTRPESSPGTEHRVEFDWAKFETARTIDRVALDITTHNTRLRPGTDVIVRHVQRRFTTTDVTRLARALVLLASPFETKTSFRPSLDAPEFASMEKLVRRGYWGQAAYVVHATLDAAGVSSAQLVDRERGGRVVNATHADLRRVKGRPPYAAPPARFDLHVFRLGGDASTRPLTSGVTLGALREWLRIVGGVHLFHRGLRVYPYGDPGHDWLEMNLRRAASPEEKPSTNNSIGQMIVLDESAVLQQKTDRTGFIETEEFHDLRQFGQDVLRWVSRVRLKEAEERRRREREKARASLAAAQAAMQAAVAAAPAAARPELQRAQRHLQAATSREVSALAGDLELYRTLATIGTTTAVMAHEAFNPPATIIKLIRVIRTRGRKLLGDDYRNIEEQVDLIERSARRLGTLVQLPRRLLDRSKRDRGTYSANTVINEALEILKPLLDDHRIRMECYWDAGDPQYVGTIAALESIITNLVINSVGALDDSRKRDRLVRVQTLGSEGVIVIDVSDNGPGISGISLEDIWLPGRGTSTRGVGLGLTIVRDLVADLNGTVEALATGALGGAQFIVQLPAVEP